MSDTYFRCCKDHSIFLYNRTGPFPRRRNFGAGQSFFHFREVPQLRSFVMHFYTLVFALGLSGSARAFSVYHKDVTKELYSDNEACFKALTVDLKCNEAIVDLNETGWQGSLEDDEDNTITDSICSKTCHQSLQQWVAGVEKDCKGERIEPAKTMPGGWEQLCDKDIAGRYCNGK